MPSNIAESISNDDTLITMKSEVKNRVNNNSKSTVGPKVDASKNNFFIHTYHEWNRIPPIIREVSDSSKFIEKCSKEHMWLLLEPD